MATSPSPQAPSVPSRRRILGPVRFILLIALIVVFVGCLVYSWTTRDAMANLPFLHGQSQVRALNESQKTIVDLHPWQTAQALAALAVSAEEVEYAREAQRLADHEVDQAFATALRQANAQPRALSEEALALSTRVGQLQQVVKDDQAKVQSMTSMSSHSGAASSDELEIAKAQLGLDSDELTDAQQDLARASGDPRDKIKQELAAHEAVMHEYDAQASNQGQTAVLSAQQDGTLYGRSKEWLSQRTRYQLIQQAMQQALTDATALYAEHRAVAGAAKNASAASVGAAQQADSSSSSTATSDTNAKLANIRTRSEQRQLLSIFDDRIQIQRQLAAVYSKWSAQVLLQHRILLHLILQSLAVIVFVIICVILCNIVVRRLLARPGLDRRRTQTLATIVQLGVQLLGLVAILLVLFGAPRQTTTVLGLTTAGLTIALQDFILAFIGWFILMGKNGIRVGDAVEINSVGGEVVEIGLFRTSMLETGNWTDTGHPTGRRITFMNKFAISGQYFNFSTAGQWMWDEIAVNVPASADTYAAIDQIHKAVLKETEKDAQLAEQEWRHSSRHRELSQISAAPAVNLRPTPTGVNIVVRYVTRAPNRFEMRNRLYECVIDVLHKPGMTETVTSKPAAPVPAHSTNGR